jgi:hypothetical protein
MRISFLPLPGGGNGSLGWIGLKEINPGCVKQLSMNSRLELLQPLDEQVRNYASVKAISDKKNTHPNGNFSHGLTRIKRG